MDNCIMCGKPSKISIKNENDYDTYCLDCHNRIMADMLGIKETLKYPKNIIFQNKKRKMLCFDVEYMIFPHAKSLTAREAETNGYQCSIYGELEDDFNIMWDKLLKKIEKLTSVQYINKDRYIAKDKAVGYVQYSRDTQECEMIVDGKPYTMDDIQKWMSGRENFQMKIEFADITDELL